MPKPSGALHISNQSCILEKPYFRQFHFNARQKVGTCAIKCDKTRRRLLSPRAYKKRVNLKKEAGVIGNTLARNDTASWWQTVQFAENAIAASKYTDKWQSVRRSNHTRRVKNPESTFKHNGICEIRLR